VMRLCVAAERCTGCESCVLSCAFRHEGAFSLTASRIRIERNEDQGQFRPRVCIQCEERSCVAACPVEALTVDAALGTIRCDEAACIGCRACGTACAYGGVQFDAGRATPWFCDLCGGAPECVATCQMPKAVTAVAKGGRSDGR
jgi:anaerobic carbon-monoxide dehydrogenase iron sulfur subunit